MNQDSRRAGLLRLRHLREVTEAKAEDIDRERHRFADLRDRQPVRAVSAFNLFQTPEPLADRLAVMLGDLTGCRVLEPSAGLGRLYRAVRYRSACSMVLVESAPQCCAELYRETAHDDDCELIQADFLEVSADRLGQFDAIVMNPPFSKGRDIKHIRRAVELLKPGGRLVALCYAGVKQRRAFADSAWNWETLPDKSFQSEGTGAPVALLNFKK